MANFTKTCQVNTQKKSQQVMHSYITQTEKGNIFRMETPHPGTEHDARDMVDLSETRKGNSYKVERSNPETERQLECEVSGSMVKNNPRNSKKGKKPVCSRRQSQESQRNDINCACTRSAVLAIITLDPPLLKKMANFTKTCQVNTQKKSQQVMHSYITQTEKGNIFRMETPHPGTEHDARDMVDLSETRKGNSYKVERSNPETERQLECEVSGSMVKNNPRNSKKGKKPVCSRRQSQESQRNVTQEDIQEVKNPILQNDTSASAQQQAEFAVSPNAVTEPIASCSYSNDSKDFKDKHFEKRRKKARKFTQHKKLKPDIETREELKNCKVIEQGTSRKGLRLIDDEGFWYTVKMVKNNPRNSKKGKKPVCSRRQSQESQRNVTQEDIQEVKNPILQNDTSASAQQQAEFAVSPNAVTEPIASCSYSNDSKDFKDKHFEKRRKKARKFTQHKKLKPDIETREELKNCKVIEQGTSRKGLRLIDDEGFWYTVKMVKNNPRNSKKGKKPVCSRRQSQESQRNVTQEDIQEVKNPILQNDTSASAQQQAEFAVSPNAVTEPIASCSYSNDSKDFKDKHFEKRRKKARKFTQHKKLKPDIETREELKNCKVIEQGTSRKGLRLIDDEGFWYTVKMVKNNPRNSKKGKKPVCSRRQSQESQRNVTQEDIQEVKNPILQNDTSASAQQQAEFAVSPNAVTEPIASCSYSNDSKDFKDKHFEKRRKKARKFTQHKKLKPDIETREELKNCKVIEQGTSRKGLRLIDDEGFWYTVKRPGKTYREWRCARRCYNSGPTIIEKDGKFYKNLSGKHTEKCLQKKSMPSYITQTEKPHPGTEHDLEPNPRDMVDLSETRKGNSFKVERSNPETERQLECEVSGSEDELSTCELVEDLMTVKLFANNGKKVKIPVQERPDEEENEGEVFPTNSTIPLNDCEESYNSLQDNPSPECLSSNSAQSNSSLGNLSGYDEEEEYLIEECIKETENLDSPTEEKRITDMGNFVLDQ